MRACTCVRFGALRALFGKKQKKLKFRVDNSKKICSIYNCSPGAGELQ